MTQTADPRRRKALACIREGRVTVRRAEEAAQQTDYVLARVRSSRDGHPYRVIYERDTWDCDCREGRRDLPCAHTLAVALVTTGVPS